MRGQADPGGSSAVRRGTTIVLPPIKAVMKRHWRGDAGTPAVLWGRRAELAEAIDQRHENPDYLPGITLTSALRATCGPAAALAATDLVVLARPGQTLRRNLAGWAGQLPSDALLASLMKGIEDGTRLRMTEVIAEVTRRRADPDRGGHRPEPGPGVRRPPVRGHRGRLRRRRHGQASAAGLPAPYFRPRYGV